MEFIPFPKMPRLSREVVVTEKIDGTNAQIYIEGSLFGDVVDEVIASKPDGNTFQTMRVGSRTRWIKPGDDNFGFAGWCKEHSEELFTLGPGRHFGEWWGSGIQRNYGLKEKRFSLFNVQRWVDQHTVEPDAPLAEKQERAPTCCHVVPILWRGMFYTSNVLNAIEDLKRNGSSAAPGFMKPEGIVIFHIAGNLGFKKTCEKDEQHKGQG